jgi:hypothetical protein
MPSLKEKMSSLKEKMSFVEQTKKPVHDIGTKCQLKINKL